MYMCRWRLCFFFFQAEDGIRDIGVTGVQTCALPILLAVVVVALYLGHRAWEVDFATRLQEEAVWKMVAFVLESAVFALIGLRSEERRVGKECRSRWSPYH